MSDEKSQQQTSTESTVAGAAKTGKAISNIAKGAAAGGAHGAAIEAGKSSAKWLIPLIAAVLLPLILVAMLPSIIFGSLLGDGTDTPNGISNDEVLVQNMTAINEGISSILSEGLTDVLERIDSDFALSGCDGKEINNPFGADVVFNANAFGNKYFVVSTFFAQCLFLTNNKEGDTLLKLILHDELAMEINHAALSPFHPPRIPTREYDAIETSLDRPVLLNYQCDLLMLSDIHPMPEGFRGSPIMLCFDYQTQVIQRIVGPAIEVRPLESRLDYG